MSKNSLQQANRCYRAGVGGAIIAAICCFTPLLVIVLGSLGLAAVSHYLDWVLLPLLAICLIVAAYGWWRMQQCRDESKQ
jgi:mercuric ion transport protein